MTFIVGMSSQTIYAIPVRLALIVGLILTIAVSVQAKAEGEGGGEPELGQSAADGSGQSEPPKSKVKKSFPYLLSFRREYTRICELMILDGRRDVFFTMLLENAETHPDCPACRQFFVAFSSACKPPKEKKIKKPKTDTEEPSEDQPTATPTATPIPLQREPNVPLIDVVSEFFTSLAERPKDPDEMMQTIRVFTGILTNPTDKTPSEIEYFSILTEYIWAPFAEKAEEMAREKHEAERAAEIKAKSERDKVDLDKLF